MSAETEPLPPAGLCNSCRHQQIVRNTRGSAFSLCRRSRDEPERFPRYPRLPVTACSGYECDDPATGAGGDPDPATGAGGDPGR